METPLRLEIQFNNNDLDAIERLKSAILRDAKDWPGVERVDRKRDLGLRRQSDIILDDLPVPTKGDGPQIQARGRDDEDESIWLKLLPSSLKQVLSIFGDYVKTSNTKSPVKLNIDGREVQFSSKQEMTPELLESYVKILSKESEAKKTS